MCGTDLMTAVVHEVTLQQAYNVNLVVYRRHDKPQYHTAADLSRIPKLGRSVVLNRKASTPSEKTEVEDGTVITETTIDHTTHTINIQDNRQLRTEA